MATPARPGARGTATGRPSPDATTVLTAYAVVLFAVPSRLTIEPLGGAGSPAQLLALGALVWWAWQQLYDRSWHLVGTHPRPVALANIAFMTCVGVSYVAAMTRPIEADEVSTADLAVVAVLAWSGVLLATHDGIPDRDRLEVLVRRLSVAAGLMALLGLVQFATGETFVERISVPGLVENSRFQGAFDRSEFVRPAATAVHPIEFGAVLTILLPFALYTARHGRSWFVRWVPSSAILLMAPFSLSRSVLVGVVLALALTVPWWPRRQRLVALVLSAGVVLTALASVPGLARTVAELFTGIGSDTSAASRLSAVDNALAAFRHGPWLGRGLGTFLPKYQILDNQVLSFLVELGVVGLAAFLSVSAAAVVVSVRVRRSTTARRDRDLAQACVAASVVGVANFSLFDGLWFPMAAGTYAVTLGIAGALHRVTTGSRVLTRDPRGAGIKDVRSSPGIQEGERRGP
ncbi:O-antigen ligase family protein [Ornithinimicrobium avium]|uniref:O-antigen ligase domain-containing protein n=1 Tax=Ornithinimicrobium avium TaxID=2283195 RepID=A0A345NMZ1_9MICO|nr:O-antigen ligase family protein [Ornithinimicrobium avium]AXH96399.1 O-antigen ligase domain-containing protein [Ornithinimicrobium avium]